jgi:uncharacterized membrane protein YcgQ (UPF0703/DUF1980 family)
LSQAKNSPPIISLAREFTQLSFTYLHLRALSSHFLSLCIHLSSLSAAKSTKTQQFKHLLKILARRGISRCAVVLAVRAAFFPQCTLFRARFFSAMISA